VGGGGSLIYRVSVELLKKTSTKGPKNHEAVVTGEDVEGEEMCPLEGRSAALSKPNCHG
jgi:hypothetical protein